MYLCMSFEVQASGSSSIVARRACMAGNGVHLCSWSPALMNGMQMPFVAYPLHRMPFMVHAVFCDALRPLFTLQFTLLRCLCSVCKQVLISMIHNHLIDQVSMAMQC